MFLGKLLPSFGKYCVAEPIQGGKGFRHFFFDTIPEAQEKLVVLDAYGNNAYIAQATFDPAKIDQAVLHNKTARTKEDRLPERAQANAVLLKNFFLDVDCGEKWPLKNQIEGLRALHEFIRETSLPFPTVVNSGNGLYAHWILTEAVNSAQWRTVAFLLKQVVAHYKPALGADSSRTSDTASVLRPVGLRNHKDRTNPKAVKLVHPQSEDDIAEITLGDFAAALEHAARRAKIDRTAVLAPKGVQDINADYYVEVGMPSDPQKVAEKCAQVRELRDKKGDVPEPLWYSAIGLLSHCTGGDEVIHEWSAGYSGYTAKETQGKIDQWRATGFGPATCVKLADSTPDLCIGCPHKDKIKSPIVLGHPEPVAQQIEETQCEPPEGYRRAEDGLHKAEDDRWVKFYDCDLWVDNIAYDATLGYEVTTIKHVLPYEGEMAFTFRSSVTQDLKSLMTVLADNHVKVLGNTEKKTMRAYLESYQQRLQRSRRMNQLRSQMGWAQQGDKPMFILGRKVFHHDGSVEDANFARNIPLAAAGFRSQGSFEDWRNATRMLSAPGMEAYAFAYLAGAYGSLLMHFTGLGGAMLNLMGPSGLGKTLLLRLILSVYGYHRDLLLLPDDTQNAVASRLGVYNNLPGAIDEITNKGGLELSTLVHRITHGSDKARLTQTAEERTTNKWQTLVVTSSNSSVLDRLSEVKHDASPEANRVFEMMLDTGFSIEEGKDLFWAVHKNFGHAGEKYIKYLVTNYDKIEPALRKAVEYVESSGYTTSEERFLTAIVACATLGGRIARLLDLVPFDIMPAVTFGINRLREMRGMKKEVIGGFIGFISRVLDKYSASCLIVTAGNGSAPANVIDTPKRSLVQRREVDTHRVYISRHVIKQEASKEHASYSQLREEGMRLGVLLNANRSKTLGGGTFYAGAPQVCWEIDLSAPSMGEEGLKMVQEDKKLRGGKA